MTDQQDTFETVDDYMARGGPIPTKVGYSRLSEGTVADFAAMQVSGGTREVGIADWLIRELKSQRGDPGVYPVNRYMHGLQTAMLA